MIVKVSPNRNSGQSIKDCNLEVCECLYFMQRSHIFLQISLLHYDEIAFFWQRPRYYFRYSLNLNGQASFSSFNGLNSSSLRFSKGPWSCLTMQSELSLDHFHGLIGDRVNCCSSGGGWRTKPKDCVWDPQRSPRVRAQRLTTRSTAATAAHWAAVRLRDWRLVYGVSVGGFISQRCHLQ